MFWLNDQLKRKSRYLWQRIVLSQLCVLILIGKACVSSISDDVIVFRSRYLCKNSGFVSNKPTKTITLPVFRTFLFIEATVVPTVICREIHMNYRPQ